MAFCLIISHSFLNLSIPASAAPLWKPSQPTSPAERKRSGFGERPPDLTAGRFGLQATYHPGEGSHKGLMLDLAFAAAFVAAKAYP